MTRLCILLPLLSMLAAADRPNVILMMTDDQGIGDFGVMGNRVLETPNIDKLAAGAASMSTFYVSPVCSPTRACLMTGRYNYRTRCIDTWIGRSMMDPEEVTIAELLKGAGYATGIFGKWHLGDCYPMRPNDQGFDESLIHLGGGLAQPSEPLENQRRYTDPILFRNGEAVQTKGFCTDVYFDAGLAFIEAQKKAGKPFFVYLPTNAPHGPYHDVPEALYQKYLKKNLASLMISPPKQKARLKQQIDQLARIAAMIENEDQNVGRLMARLNQLGLTGNTLVIRLNDNGPNGMRYVGRMRGMKTHVHEGGVRSPLWMHWPKGLKAGTTRSELSAHIDILPTVLEACRVDRPDNLDGRSFLPLLLDPAATAPERTIVIQSHRGDRPVRYNHFMIRDSRYKLLNASGFGRETPGEPKFELYDLANDPGERTNLAADQPAILHRLKTAYDAWFDDVSSTRPNNYAPPRIVIGTPHENPTALTRQDWRGGPWNLKSRGHWELTVAKDGQVDVEIVLEPSRVPAEEFAVVLRIQGKTLRKSVVGNTPRVTFKQVPAMKGEAVLNPLVETGDVAFGAYQALVTFK